MYNTKYICLFVSLFLLMACVKKEGENVQFTQIQIQFYPSFMTPSMITLNLSDSTMIFSRIGTKEFSDLRQFPDTIIKTAAPSSFKLRLEDSTYDCLKLIQFQKEDLIDREEDYLDGIYTNMLFNHRKGELIDVELKNSKTATQQVFILKLLDEAQIKAPDSLTSKYLSRLKKYY